MWLETCEHLLIDVLTEPFSCQDFVEFGESRKRKQNHTSSKSLIKCSARFRVGKEQSTNEDVRIEDATQLCALQDGIQYLRLQPPRFRFSANLIENLTERGVFPRREISQPKAQKSLHLALFLGASGIVCFRRLRIERDRNCGVRHGNFLP
jgi:hypothetical protein